MTTSDYGRDGALPPRRPGWMIFVPTGLLLLLAGGWTAAWFYAANRAESEVTAAIEREAKKGRIWDCGERHVSGYPFRIEFNCASPTAKLPAEGGQMLASAPTFRAVAQVYDPNKLIGELVGPVQLTFPDGARAEVSYQSAQASVTLSGGKFERASAVVEQPRGSSGQDAVGAAEHLEAHLRRSPDNADAYDFVARIDKAEAPVFQLVSIGDGPVSAELQVEATGVGDLRAGPIEERLRGFAAANGKLHVALARVERGDVIAQAKGDLKLDDEGRVNGALDLKTRGLEDAIADLLGGAAGGGGKKNALSAILGMGAAALGSKAELDGKKAVAYPLTIEKGKVALGPIKFYKLPPLF